jgi:hypothetical protein
MQFTTPLTNGAAGSSRLGAQTCRPDMMGVNNATIEAWNEASTRNCDPNLVEKKLFNSANALYKSRFDSARTLVTCTTLNRASVLSDIVVEVLGLW